jgi:hypothetical protein
MASEAQIPRFAIFRGKDARPDSEVGLMTYEEFTPVAADGLRRAREAGFDAGHHLRVLFAAPGFSLVYLWFKSAFPLPHHVHNVDCLYCILGGSLSFGQEELGAGDGFFVGRDVPYHYTPGPAGVELLEFRASDAFNIRVLANNRAFWDRAIETIRSHHIAWLSEQRPTVVRST